MGPSQRLPVAVNCPCSFGADNCSGAFAVACWRLICAGSMSADRVCSWSTGRPTPGRAVPWVGLRDAGRASEVQPRPGLPWAFIWRYRDEALAGLLLGMRSDRSALTWRDRPLPVSTHCPCASQPPLARPWCRRTQRWAAAPQGILAGAGSRVLQLSLPNAYWNRLGLKTLSQTWQRLDQKA